MAFTPIETQEQLDALISDRLRRDRESQAKKYEDWKSPEDITKITDSLNAKIKELEDAAELTNQTLASKDEEIAKGEKYRTDLEKTRIALSAGLDIKYADRLRGETEEEWKADAAELAKDFVGARKLPHASQEPTELGKASARDKFAEWMAAELKQ